MEACDAKRRREDVDDDRVLPASGMRQARRRYGAGMRWEDLFDDLEAQLAAQRRRSEDAELVDVVRAERARVTWMDRLRAQPGEVTVVVAGGRMTGQVVDVGPDWLLLRRRPASGEAAAGLDDALPGQGAPGSRDTVVPAAAVRALTGLLPGVVPADGIGRSLGLASVLRRLAGDRAVVRVGTADGTTLTGTPSAVGVDHLDLRCHDTDDPTGRGARWTLPFTAVTSVTLG